MILLLLALLIFLVVSSLFRLWSFIFLIKQETQLFALVPPSSGDKTLDATEQFFHIVHGFIGSASLKNRMLSQKVVLSFEVVSTKKGGIQFLVNVPVSEAAGFKKMAHSYLPELKIYKCADYLKSDEFAVANISDYKQSGHFAFPLSIKDNLKDIDPIAYITGAMTKLKKDEVIALQLIINPIKTPRAIYLSKKILRGDDPSVYLSEYFRSNSLFNLIFYLLRKPFLSFGSKMKNNYSAQLGRGKGSSRHSVISPLKQELLDDMFTKLNSDLYQASIRTLVYAFGEKAAADRNKELKGSLSSFSTSLHQSLKARRTIPVSIARKYRSFKYFKRLPTLFTSNSSYFSSLEIANIYHFPNTQSSKTENVVKLHSRTLPAPLSMKDGTKVDLYLGTNEYHGQSTKIGLTSMERSKHIYIIGSTGSGKTTMLLNAISQDINSGKGLAVIDPHGDLAEAALRLIPEDRVKDVIYINPDDLKHPIGLNLLELADDLEGDELLREKDLITESVVSIFRKIFSSDDSGGHRVEYVLRNTVQTALFVKNATLFTVFNLLNDPMYRKDVLKNVKNPDLIRFWNNEIGMAGNFQRVKMASGITSKVGRFLFSASAKKIIEQPRSTIDFENLIQTQKILICNFSKGALGDDTSELFGITILTKIQIASLRRSKISQDERAPFYLYVDEFQNFATHSFAQMLSEARKFGLRLTIAEQSTAQQPDQQLVSVILANVGTVLSFRTGSPDDEDLILPLFQPYISKGELSSLDSYNFYVRIFAVKVQEPVSGTTSNVTLLNDEEAVQRIIKSSRDLYTVKNTEVVLEAVKRQKKYNFRTVPRLGKHKVRQRY